MVVFCEIKFITCLVLLVIVRFYSPEAPLEKKFDTGSSIASDGGQGSQPVAASSEDDPAPSPKEEERNSLHSGDAVKELNAAVDRPHASRIQQTHQDAHASGSASAATSGSSVLFISK